MLTQTLPTEKQLKRAMVLRGQIVTIAAKLEEKQAELRTILTLDEGETEPTPVAKKAVRTMSPEGRAKIAAGQKARWKKFHADQKVAASEPTEPVTESETAPAVVS